MKDTVDEREVKLSLADDAAALDPAAIFAGLGRWTDDVVEQCAVYYDTEDLRLTRAGASLRFRSDDGWTVKTPVARRRRRGGPGRARLPGRRRRRPPAAATDLLVGWTRGRRSRRSPPSAPTGVGCGCSRDEAAPRSRWSTTPCAPRPPPSPPTAFREVEAELAPGGDARTLRQVVRRLRAGGATAGGGPSKVAHALGARGARRRGRRRPG